MHVLNVAQRKMIHTTMFSSARTQFDLLVSSSLHAQLSQACRNTLETVECDTATKDLHTYEAEGPKRSVTSDSSKATVWISTPSLEVHWTAHAEATLSFRRRRGGCRGILCRCIPLTAERDGYLIEQHEQ